MKNISAGFLILLICVIPYLLQADDTPFIAYNHTTTFVRSNSEVILSINNIWWYKGLDCFGTCLEMENDVDVAALQINILLDTSFYIVQGVKKRQGLSRSTFSTIVIGTSRELSL